MRAAAPGHGLVTHPAEQARDRALGQMPFGHVRGEGDKGVAPFPDVVFLVGPVRRRHGVEVGAQGAHGVLREAAVRPARPDVGDVRDGLSRGQGADHVQDGFLAVAHAGHVRDREAFLGPDGRVHAAPEHGRGDPAPKRPRDLGGVVGVIGHERHADHGRVGAKGNERLDHARRVALGLVGEGVAQGIGQEDQARGHARGAQIRGDGPHAEGSDVGIGRDEDDARGRPGRGGLWLHFRKDAGGAPDLSRRPLRRGGRMPPSRGSPGFWRPGPWSGRRSLPGPARPGCRPWPCSGPG